MKMKEPIPGVEDIDLSVVDLEAYRVRRKATFCLHRRVELDPGNRSISCRDCKAPLDAFDALVKFATEWERLREVVDLRKKLQAHIADLKRLTTNARAAARRAGAKEIPWTPQ